MMQVIKILFLLILFTSVDICTAQEPKVHKRVDGKTTHIWTEYEDQSTDALIAHFIEDLKKKYNAQSLQRVDLPQPKKAIYYPNQSVGMDKTFVHLATLSPQYSQDIIAFLKSHINKLPTPYIYELARRVNEFDKEESHNWVYLGMIMAKYDARRCADKTARQGIVFWKGFNEKLLLEMQEIDRDTLNKQVFTFILNKMDEMNWEKPAQWICFHGMGAVRGMINSTNYMKPQEEWPGIVEQYKGQLEDYLNKN